MKNLENLKTILPAYPRTKHVPHKPNAVRDDLVATEAEARIMLESDRVQVTEKVDGSHCGMALYEGEPVIRNRDHILNKGYVKDTPAKKQFSSVFNWFYDNKKLFEAINDIAGSVSVRGEWLFAVHGLEYDLLPSMFIAYDVYDYEAGKYLATPLARKYLIEAGFVVVPELFFGKLDNYSQLEEWSNQPSPFTSKGNREGVYVKVSDDNWVTARFKMVRQGFQQGGLWDEKKLKKNALEK